ncbi:unnamed protein product, partial [Ectocarpus fasciculatus]
PAPSTTTSGRGARERSRTASRGEGLGDPNREPEGLHPRSGKREWHKKACLSSNNTWRTKRLACESGTTPIMCLNDPSS